MQQTGINITFDLNDLDPEGCTGIRIKFRSADQSYLLMAGYPAESPVEPIGQPDDRSSAAEWPGEYELSPAYESGEAALSAAASALTDHTTQGYNEAVNYHEVKLYFRNPEAIPDRRNAEEIALDMLGEELAAAKNAKAILIEPLIPAGRFLLGTGFFGEFESRVRHAGLPLIADERRTGLGLTGRIWAFEHFDLKPDVILFGNTHTGIHYLLKKTTIAKKKKSEISERLFRVMRQLDDEMLAVVRATGTYLLEKLSWLEREFPAYVTCVRGLGLFAGFNLPSDTERREVLERSAENGLILEYDGERSILLRPALTVTTAELDRVIELLNRAILDTLK
ncbi:MAG: aminotransferase class III-fold pyridoxal phosphate-dependent enzyme [FCB group bacterium]|nr:aminotransferase class III-fold pyridoxal phosphate-dependent enzyme [FCB group bacterium]